MTQGVLRSAPHIGPPPLELLVGLQIINTLRLLRTDPEDGAVVVEDIAEGEIASPSDERSLAVDAQRRRGDAVP